MQFHECPTRAIVNVVKEAFRLLRPGGTIAMTDNSVYKIMIMSLFKFLLLSQTLISLLLSFAAKVESPTGIFRLLFLTILLTSWNIIKVLHLFSSCVVGVVSGSVYIDEEHRTVS